MSLGAEKPHCRVHATNFGWTAQVNFSRPRAA